MLIKRDMAVRLQKDKGTYVQILIGPRQSGKSTLFAILSACRYREVSFDDFQMRNLAERDPALFLAQYPPPLIIDEIQYVPHLFPEIKRLIDELKRDRLFNQRKEPIEVLFYRRK